MNELQKAAEILVECGYADTAAENSNYIMWNADVLDSDMEAVKPFSDTLEGRRQACDIWDYLIKEKTALYRNSAIVDDADKEWDYVLLRIKWCLQELSK